MRSLGYFLFFCWLFSNQGNTVEPLYVVNTTDSKIFRVDITTGASAPVTSVIGTPPGIGNAGANGIKLATRTLGYTVGFNDSLVYQVNLETGAFSPVTSSPLGSLFGLSEIALASAEKAYVINQTDQTIYSVDLTTGASAIVATISEVPTPFISDLTLVGNTAYVVGFNNSNIFAVNLTNGTYTKITPSPALPHGLDGIAILNNTAYIIDLDTGRFFSVDLATSQSTLLVTLPLSVKPFDLAIDGMTAYTAGTSDAKVYAIDLQSNTFRLVTPNPVGTVAPLASDLGIGLYPSIYTVGLSGNILRFADYLNENAPISTLNLFDFLRGSLLDDALEAAMPARLGFSTFAAQNGYLASTQVVTDHLYQKRFFGKFDDKNRRVSMNLSERELLASRGIDKIGRCCGNQGFSTLWLGAFGEYAHEKAQSQTPAFHLSLGGAVLGLDYNGVDGDVVGIGASYAYTHLKEEKHMGDANVNQGFLGVYSLLRAGYWYFDLGVWGGYYQSANHRKISFFPSYNAIAKSKTHGWQAAPHFEVGYDGYFSTCCPEDKFGVSPFLLADWVANWENGFSEHGAPDLNAHQKAKFCSLFRGEAGLRFYEILTLGRGQLILQEKGSYAYQKMFHTGTVTAFLVGSPGSFTVGTLISAQNLGVIEFSALFKPWNPNAPYITFRYQGEFGSMYQSHQGIFEIGKDF